MVVRTHRIAAAVLVALAGVQPAAAQDADLATQLVDALNNLFGKHPGYRAAHAKGIVAKGTFQAAPAAASLSEAVIFEGAVIPVTVRFSDATGLPNVPDGSTAANPHGLAIKFHLADGSETDIVLNSLKFFPVGTGEDFLAMLRASAESPPSAAKPTKFDQFVARHPSVAAASTTTRTPASFADEEYRGLDAFVFVSRTGTRQAVRYIATPEKLVYLDPAEAAKKPPNYLLDDLAARLAAAPVTFHLQAQLATPADSTKDASRPWPDSNKVVDLGVLTIETLVPDSPAVERDLLFLPGRVIDGIEPSDDPLIAVRDAVYAVSSARRSQ